MVNASISKIAVTEDVTRFQVWVPPSSRGKSTTLHLKLISNSREGLFVNPTDMTIHVVPGESIVR